MSMGEVEGPGLQGTKMLAVKVSVCYYDKRHANSSATSKLQNNKLNISLPFCVKF